MMLCFYTTRANFAILPHPNKANLSQSVSDGYYLTYESSATLIINE
jgi:hypothetical protein